MNPEQQLKLLELTASDLAYNAKRLVEKVDEMYKNVAELEAVIAQVKHDLGVG